MPQSLEVLRQFFTKKCLEPELLWREMGENLLTRNKLLSIICGIYLLNNPYISQAGFHQHNQVEWCAFSHWPLLSGAFIVWDGYLWRASFINVLFKWEAWRKRNSVLELQNQLLPKKAIFYSFQPGQISPVLCTLVWSCDFFPLRLSITDFASRAGLFSSVGIHSTFKCIPILSFSRRTPCFLSPSCPSQAAPPSLTHSAITFRHTMSPSSCFSLRSPSWCPTSFISRHLSRTTRWQR